MAVFIPDIWGCVAQTERAAAIACSNPTTVPPAFVPAAVIDPIFAMNGTIDPTIRRETWEAMWVMERVTIEMDEVEVEGYFTLQQWNVDVWDCRQEGDCQLSDPPCLQAAFINSP